MGNNSCVADVALRLMAILRLMALRLKACILYFYPPPGVWERLEFEPPPPQGTRQEEFEGLERGIEESLSRTRYLLGVPPGTKEGAEALSVVLADRLADWLDDEELARDIPGTPCCGLCPPGCWGWWGRGEPRRWGAAGKPRGWPGWGGGGPPCMGSPPPCRLLSMACWCIWCMP